VDRTNYTVLKEINEFYRVQMENGIFGIDSPKKMPKKSGSSELEIKFKKMFACGFLKNLGALKSHTNENILVFD
jgi:hypothetical protein